MTLTAAIMAVVNGILAVLLAWGVDLTTDQQTSVTVLVNAVLVLGALVYDRRKGIRLRDQVPASSTGPTGGA